MAKLTIAQAKAQGYQIDTTCYPHIGYIGNRFEPDTQLVMPQVETFTEVESDLLEACELMLMQLSGVTIWATTGIEVATERMQKAVAKAKEEENG